MGRQKPMYVDFAQGSENVHQLGFSSQPAVGQLQGRLPTWLPPKSCKPVARCLVCQSYQFINDRWLLKELITS